MSEQININNSNNSPPSQNDNKQMRICFSERKNPVKRINFWKFGNETLCWLWLDTFLLDDTTSGSNRKVLSSHEVPRLSLDANQGGQIHGNEEDNTGSLLQSSSPVEDELEEIAPRTYALITDGSQFRSPFWIKEAASLHKLLQKLKIRHPNYEPKTVPPHEELQMQFVKWLLERTVGGVTV